MHTSLKAGYMACMVLMYCWVRPDHCSLVLLIHMILTVVHQLEDFLKLENTYSAPGLAQSCGLLHASCVSNLQFADCGCTSISLKMVVKTAY